MADNHGNKVAREGCDRCSCGCKYWENDRCIDCGTRIEDLRKEATPRPGTVTDSRGAPCPRADVSSYPLYATCDNCGGIIRCADGTADWCHTCDYRGQCSEASKIFGVKS